MITQKRMVIPIFNYRLSIIIYDNWEEVKYLDEGGPEPKAIVVHSYGATTVAINAKEESSIIHEAEHIKNAVWKFIGYRPQEDNDEVDAYLLTYVYKKIKEVFNKHDKAAK